ncbi:MAG: NHL repeat-containing protein [Candidatus Zixiibacteriota bacterium]
MIQPGLSGQWSVDTASYAGGKLTIISGFVGPYGLTVTSDGSLFVPDLKEGRIVRFSPELAYTGWLGMRAEDSAVSGWHTSGSPIRGDALGQFDFVHSVDFDPNGVLYAADYTNARIHRYAANGEFLGLFFDTPADTNLKFTGCPFAAFDRDGFFWVSDFDGNRIYKFNQRLELIGWLGEFAGGGITNGFADSGSAQQSAAFGGLFKPHMIRTDAQGNFYVVESGNHRIQKFAPDGSFIGWLGTYSNGQLTNGWATDGTAISSTQPGGFIAPVSLFIVGDSLLFVADNGNHRVQKFGIDGTFRGWMGAKAEGGVTSGWEMTGLSAESTDPGGFSAPFDVKYYNGTYYIADGHNGRIQIFELENL